MSERPPFYIEAHGHVYIRDPHAHPTSQVKRIAELEANQQWQPIETAPKDETFVLLTGGSDYSNEPIPPCVVGFWCGEWSDDNYWAYAYWDSVWRSGYQSPTHWMPLPEKPEVMP